MKTPNLITLVAMVVALGSNALADAQLNSPTIAFKSENWKVLYYKDIMSDKITCTGFYRDDYGVQLTANSLLIRVAGGLESMTLRFGDEQITPPRNLTDLERSSGIVELSGLEFAHVQSVNRIRYQASMRLSRYNAGDIDLTGLKQALENINANCPVPRATSVASK